MLVIGVIHGDEDDKDTIGREVRPVAKDVLVHIADPEPVDVDVAGGHTFAGVRRFFIDFQHIAVREYECVPFRNPDRFRELRMHHEVTVLAVIAATC